MSKPKSKPNWNVYFELACPKCEESHEFEAFVCPPERDVGIMGPYLDDWDGPDQCRKCQVMFEEDYIAELAVEHFVEYDGPDRKEDVE